MHIYNAPPPPFEFTIHQIHLPTQSDKPQYTYNGTWHDLPITLTLSKEKNEATTFTRLNAYIANTYHSIKWIDNIPNPTIATNTEHFLHLSLTPSDATTIINCTTPDACTHAINNIMQRFASPEQYERYNIVCNIIQYLHQKYPDMQTNSIMNTDSNIATNHLTCKATNTILWPHIDQINHWCGNNILHIEKETWRRAMNILHIIQMAKYRNHPQVKLYLQTPTHHISQHECIQYIRALQKHNAPSLPYV